MSTKSPIEKQYITNVVSVFQKSGSTDWNFVCCIPGLQAAGTNFSDGIGLMLFPRYMKIWSELVSGFLTNLIKIQLKKN